MTQPYPVLKPGVNVPRRILLIGHGYADSMASNVLDTLERAGVSVLLVPPGLSMDSILRIPPALRRFATLARDLAAQTTTFRRRHLSSLVRTAAAFRPDVILTFHDFLLPNEVAALRDATGAPMAMWFPDSIANASRAVFLHAPYSALFFKDPYMVRVFGEIAKPDVHLLPEAFSPHLHRVPDGVSVSDPKYVCDITTAGNMHAHRVALFEHLTDFDLRLWGNPFPRWMPAPTVRPSFQGRYVVHAEKARAFRSARIVLNSQHPTEVGGVNVRTFETAGIGAFQITTNTPGVRGAFEIGQEIVTYDNLSDLRDKISHYLMYPGDRNKIAEAGYLRAISEHTYEHRIENLFSRTKLLI